MTSPVSVAKDSGDFRIVVKC